MSSIKTVADFKRAMQPGTFWLCQHRYTNKNQTEPMNLGIRECKLSNTVGFASKTGRGTLSRCDWPTKDQFSVCSGTVVITRSFCELRYTQI